MITDPVPRKAGALRSYLASDGLRSLELPDAASLRSLAERIEATLGDGARAELAQACAAFAAEVAHGHGVAEPPVQVLGVRPHRTDGGVCVYEKFGDYDLESAKIRIWMRTAMRHQVTSYGTFLATLCHELVHHLDVAGFAFTNSPHTRGFYERAGLLYHHARGNAARKLVWVEMRDGRYRIDWARTMRSAP